MGTYWKGIFLTFCIRQKFSKPDWARLSAVRYSIVLSLTLDWILDMIQAWWWSTWKPDLHLLSFPCISEKLPDLVSVELLYIERKHNHLPLSWIILITLIILSNCLRRSEKSNSILLYVELITLIFFLQTNGNGEFLWGPHGIFSNEITLS